MSTGKDSRLGNEQTAARTPRESSDRTTTENRELTDQQRLDMFMFQSYQESLPKLPSLKGFHVCWLTTTNPRDSIQSRINIGYQLIKSTEIPGWDHNALKTGDYAGCIGINEMVAAKLPNHLYQAYMTHSFHTQPLAEEGKLAEVANSMKEEAESRGIRRTIIEAAPGTANLGKRTPKAPNFLDDDNNRPVVRPPLIPGVQDSDMVEVTEG